MDDIQKNCPFWHEFDGQCCAEGNHEHTCPMRASDRAVQIDMRIMDTLADNGRAASQIVGFVGLALVAIMLAAASLTAEDRFARHDIAMQEAGRAALATAAEGKSE